MKKQFSGFGQCTRFVTLFASVLLAAVVISADSGEGVEYIRDGSFDGVCPGRHCVPMSGVFGSWVLSHVDYHRIPVWTSLYAVDLNAGSAGYIYQDMNVPSGNYKLSLRVVSNCDANPVHKFAWKVSNAASGAVIASDGPIQTFCPPSWVDILKDVTIPTAQTIRLRLDGYDQHPYGVMVYKVSFRRISASESRSKSASSSASVSSSVIPASNPINVMPRHWPLSSVGGQGKKFGEKTELYGNYLIASRYECDTASSSRSCGRLYILQRESSRWLLRFSLRHPGNTASFEFGRSFSVRNGLLFVSAERDVNQVRKYSIIPFSINPTNGYFERKKRLNSPKVVDRGFGRTITTGGSYVAIGAPTATHKSGRAEAGAVVIYQISDSPKWQKKYSVIQPDSLKIRERFGSAMSLSASEYLAVSNRCDNPADDAVYVYELHSIHVAVKQKLQKSGSNGFGQALTFWDNMLYISAPDDSSLVNKAGSIHEYEVSDSGSVIYRSSINTVNVALSRVGSSLCVDGRYMLASRWVCKEGQTCSHAGVVDVFFNDEGEWSFLGTLSDGAEDGSDRYGSSLSCKGDLFVVGAPVSGATLSDGGTVHVYGR